MTASPEVRELGLKAHPLNFITTHYDVLRAREAAIIDGHTSVSDVVRAALDEAFAELDRAQPGRLADAAVAELEFRAAREKRRTEYRQQP